MTAATARYIHQGVPGSALCFLPRLRVAVAAGIDAASMVYSSASPRRLPPTKRMYRNDTNITIRKVRIASADPSP